MNKQEVIEKYRAGFVVHSGKHRICDEEWILSGRGSLRKRWSDGCKN
ncbi:hypothetical protein HCC71_09185 [Streptococcus suis]|nr:hypothetical protein [Streptococcus suis]HEM5302551.1 hypothetical protein [Streptococcus suis]